MENPTLNLKNSIQHILSQVEEGSITGMEGLNLDEVSSLAGECLSSFTTEGEFNNFKSFIHGRKGIISEAFSRIPEIPKERKGLYGKVLNTLKNQIEAETEKFLAKLKTIEKEKALLGLKIDVSLPGMDLKPGGRHPVSIVMEEVSEIFKNFGFTIEDGPDIESDYYNFEALNIPKEHPARDMQDTFYIERGLLLRTHTSPIQIRAMEKMKPPLRVLAPGSVYRRDSDVTHTPMFHQIEGFMVDEDISMANLKWILSTFLRELFGAEKNVRFRPSFFPFTEPSMEADIECVICLGKGCRVCKQTGWLEILGAGMIHPEVFKSVGYDYDKYSGFAFGMGIERIAMLKYSINDLRMFFENDIRFISQFR